MGWQFHLWIKNVEHFVGFGLNSGNYQYSNRTLLSTDTVRQVRFFIIYDIVLIMYAIPICQCVKFLVISIGQLVQCIPHRLDTLKSMYFYFIHMLLILANYNYYSSLFKITQVLSKKQYIFPFFHNSILNILSP